MRGAAGAARPTAALVMLLIKGVALGEAVAVAGYCEKRRNPMT